MTKKKFDTADVISIACNSVIVDDMDGLFNIVNFMLNDKIRFDELAKAASVCREYILQKYPELKEFNDIKHNITPGNYKDYVKNAKIKYGDKLIIEKAPSGVWDKTDPIKILKDALPNGTLIIEKTRSKV